MSSLSYSIYTNDKKKNQKRQSTLSKFLKKEDDDEDENEIYNKESSFNEINENTNNKSIDISNKINDDRNKKINDIIEKMTPNNNLNDTNDNYMSDFKPPPKPYITNNKNNISNNKKLQTTNIFDENNYSNYKTSYDSTNVNNYIENFNNKKMNNFNNIDNDIMTKINYMIHLLEEQKNEKTNNITEEFILYTFLGIFMIFVVDSFSKSTKYVR